MAELDSRTINLIQKAHSLKTSLDSFRPLNSETEQRIMQKFRLDWNYHSNNLEGNTLTYGETKALLLFGVTAQGKPLQDHFEVTGHNEAINYVIDLIKDEMPLTETFIRQLHKLLLKEDHYKDAVTADGTPTRRLIEVGKYKTQPNHVVTITNEVFYFATPEETPAKMQELVNWFRAEKEDAEVEPISLAAEFHYRFIRIHPFDDGNGRVARILMNFILMQFGYPPVIIKTEDKQNYFRVLRLADTGQLSPFIGYITENLIRSLEIMISGAKGQSIEEAEDLDKQLALLEQEAKSVSVDLGLTKNRENILEVFHKSIQPFAEHFVDISRKFEKFYERTNFGFSNGNSVLASLKPETFEAQFSNDTEGFYISASYTNFSLKGFDPFYFSVTYSFTFEKFEYVIKFGDEPILSNKYGITLTEDEIKDIIKKSADKHTQIIKNKIEETRKQIRNS